MNMAAKEPPTVTVVVPTYNQHDTIGRCLDSILSQKTDFPFQVQVLDDASTDGTSDIVRDYAMRDARIVPVIRERNMGAVDNAKERLKKVSSEFFIITEGDDYWTDGEKLQLQVDALRRHPECSCSGHLTEMKDGEGNHLQYHGRRIKGDEAVFDIYRAPACHTTAMLFRNFLPSLSESQWRSFEGDNMYFFVALDRGKMVYLNRVMSVYTVNRKGIWTGLSKDEKAESERIGLFKIDQFLDFKYTKMLQTKYMPGRPKTLLEISIPIWKGRRFMVKFQKTKCAR